MSSTEKNTSYTDTPVELTPELKRLEKANNSLKIVKEMSLLGVSSGVKSVRNILLLVIVNFVFLLGGIYLLFSGSFAYKKLFFLLLIIAVGVFLSLLPSKKYLTYSS